MFRRIALAALLLQTYFTAASHLSDTFKPSEQTILNPANYYRFRDAVKEDVRDIVRVIIDAFSPSASYRYTAPEYEKYKDEIRYCAEREITRQWDRINTNTTSAKVIAVPISDPSDGRSERVVAVSIWKQIDQNDTTMSAAHTTFESLQYGLPIWDSPSDDTIDMTSIYNCSAHRGTNTTRAADLNRQLGEAQTKYLTNVYPQQLYLSVLATHPDWDGHGFAAQSLHWGIENATKLEEPVTLIATPVGFPLYESVGFRSVKNVSIEMLDGWEGENLWFEVMDYQ